ncbi:MAG: HU family DNA-binding protein [Spiroplasma poulsonii]|uniref:DNA-binding protein HU n=1 Tax=Spiroplasma poulsonii TaxID=2138 RepID=A0A2P6FEZ1_9MOLU|nr:MULTISPECIES: HU family DNA-binding protein [Spiroplasma]KAF0850285.1 DNA-binding protein HU [Spiroplasma poulsonii]MBH8623296.1 HU family DNA-binding protein [Spiroplasma sp. hyd1]MBW1242080.1 HU family DNA-binding protein [Spiroplasma poulsonii]MBW3057739.1 HU family DNA-binding protein [Spiroplasma poulsonii]PQM31934.1 DNA-binding protein HU [Spiroplasma poulsonii]
MSKKELAELIAGQFNLLKSQAGEIVDFAFDRIKENLVTGNEVAIAGFGKFFVSARAAREGRNPATSETIKIPASKAAKFKAAKQLKDALN